MLKDLKVVKVQQTTPKQGQWVTPTYPQPASQLSVWFQITPLPSFHNDSQAATLWHLLPQANTVFFKAKCSIYYSNHLAYVILYYSFTRFLYVLLTMFLNVMRKKGVKA